MIKIQEKIIKEFFTKNKSKPQKPGGCFLQ
jgi:hypothetical protein